MSIAEIPVPEKLLVESPDDELQTRVFEQLADTAGAELSELTLDASLEKTLGLDSLDLHDFAFRLGKITGTKVQLTDLAGLWGGHPSVHGAIQNHQRNPDSKIYRRNASRDLKDEDVPQPTVADLMKFVHAKMRSIQSS